MNIIKKLENIIYKNINKRMHIRTTTRESIKVLKNIKSLTQCEEFEFLLDILDIRYDRLKQFTH